ncbi:MAG: DUF6070 family protein [Lachnospiraceae bacterium]
MLWKKTDWFWKIGLIAINTMLLLSVSGCSDTPQMETDPIENKSEVQIPRQNGQEGAEKLIEICSDIYEKAAEGNKSADLEVIRSIVNRLGENGYAAVDSENQIDMTEAEQVMQFCEQVDAKEEAELSIIEVSYSGGFTKYDLKTEGGNVDIVQGYFQYESGQLINMSTSSYRADTWQYTEDGYLMFSGVWFSEMYILTLSGVDEHTALRVQPLDEKCRELNRKYLLPISYKQNNMFLVDWSEDDFGELNFYDFYDIFYSPYAADVYLEVDAVNRIPEAGFENIIMTYFNIDSETLRLKTTYYAEDKTYEYKPRGFYEVEYPEIPYSEVVSCIENSDETITLTVNAVYPNEDTSKLYVHEVVIRTLEDGRFQYVSNRVLTAADDHELWWHTDRLTEEEWEEIYGGSE